ncbi:hypothetical protein CR513_22895, partial [Mucuna pruriens]
MIKRTFFSACIVARVKRWDTGWGSELPNHREERSTFCWLSDSNPVVRDTSSFVSWCTKLSESNPESVECLCTDNSVASSNVFVELGQMENNDRTLKELATPDVA